MMKWLPITLLFFAAFPTTTTYKLESFSFGSAGNANSTTSNYALEGIAGEISGTTGSTSTYKLNPGFIETQQANLPTLSAFDNGSGVYYNKLHFVINEQGNPPDATYALSISTDNFATNTNYIKNDLTVTGSLSLTDYQTYAAWGGASGANIIGLAPSTTYYLRVKATQGKFTESSFGPISSVATVGPSLSFSTSITSVAFGSLLTNTVINAPQTIDITFATNAASGGDVYINGLNNGLFSASKNATIPSATGDLSSLSRGYGARVTATGAGGGTFTSVSPYNGSTNNIGLTDTTIRQIMTANAPVTGGTASVLLKAKSTVTDPTATDYTDTITMLASGSF